MDRLHRVIIFLDAAQRTVEETAFPNLTAGAARYVDGDYRARFNGFEHDGDANRVGGAMIALASLVCGRLRLRRLVLSDRFFFITCRVLPRRRALAEPDFPSWAQMLRERREKHRFLLTAPSRRFMLIRLSLQILP